MVTHAELLAARERKDKAQHRFDELCRNRSLLTQGADTAELVAYDLSRRHAMKLSVAADLEYEDLLDKYIRQVEDAQ